MVLKSRFLYIIWKNTCTTGKTLMNRLGNSLEKKIVHFSLLEDAGVLQGEMKIKTEGWKMEKCWKI